MNTLVRRVADPPPSPPRATWSRRAARASALALACGLVAPAASADPSPELARHLADEGDHFRAISEYKALAFRETDPERRAAWQLAIGRSYRLSGRHEHSVATLTRLLSAKPPDDLVPRIHLQLALGYVGMQAPAVADLHLAEAARRGQEGRALVIGGLSSLVSNEPEEARRKLRLAAPLVAGDPAFSSMATEIDQAAARYADAPSKSPALAAALSAVLPGAGQAYTGHWFDAAQAFGFVGAFSFTSYLAYDHDRARGGPYVLTSVALSITAFFYVANVIGAHRTARYFNQHERDEIVVPVRAHVLGTADP